MSDPEPIDFDFGTPGAGADAGDAGGADEVGVAGDARDAGDAIDPGEPAAAAARVAAADAAFAVTSYPYAPSAIVRATPPWAESVARGTRREPWSRQRRLTMGILLALLAIAGAAVIALSIRAIDAFMRGG